MEQNRELNQRVQELTKIKKNLRDKIALLEGREDILMANTNGKKVKELVGYMEKQRNIYKSNVEQLLNKLDPDRRPLGTISHFSFLPASHGIYFVLAPKQIINKHGTQHAYLVSTFSTCSVTGPSIRLLWQGLRGSNLLGLGVRLPLAVVFFLSFY